MVLVCTPIIAENVYASSPSLVRQAIRDAEEDLQLIFDQQINESLVITRDGDFFPVGNAEDRSQCIIPDVNNALDIKSISYVSDGKILNGTIWLTQPISTLSNDSFKESLEWLHLSVLNASYYSNNNLDSLVNATISSLQPHFTIETNNNTLIANRYPAYKITYFPPIDFQNLDLQNQGQQVTYATYLAIINNTGYAITYQAPTSQIDSSLPAIEKNIINSSTILDFTPSSIKYIEDWVEEFSPGINSISNPLSNMTIMDSLFRSPLPVVNDFIPWRYVQFAMLVSVDSAYSRSSYYYRIHWNNTSLSWDKEFYEQGLGSSDVGFHKMLFESRNSTDFFSEGKNYVNFNVDLKYMNFPETFRVFFYTVNRYVTDRGYCDISDISDWGLVPPPRFNISASPASLDLRPGDEKDITISIKSNTAKNHFIDFSSNETNDSDVSIKLPPGREVPISGETVATLSVNASKNAQTKIHNIPIGIAANFPSEARAVASNESVDNPTNTTIRNAFRLTVNVIPPDFNMTTSPASLDLRPGDEKDIMVRINSDSNLNPPVTFRTDNPPCPIQVSFLPNITNMVPSGITTSTMHIKILEKATASPCSFPILAEIEGYNNTQTDFTLTVLPAITPEEEWHNRMQSVADFLSPVNSIWTFLTAIGAVMVPFILRRFSKKQEKDKKKNKKIDDYGNT